MKCSLRNISESTTKYVKILIDNAQDIVDWFNQFLVTSLLTIWVHLLAQWFVHTFAVFATSVCVFFGMKYVEKLYKKHFKKWFDE